MAAHLDSFGGLLYAEAVSVALAATLGKSASHALVEAAAKRAVGEQRHLREVLAEDAQVNTVLDAARLDALFAADSWRGMSDTWIDRVLAAD
jgi:3-carboxy-cis,cis-muconate cycloisomerase